METAADIEERIAELRVRDLSRTFDRVVVINLSRRPDRLARFWQHLGDWPFPLPERFEAIDSHATGAPSHWTLPIGAWGCMLSHRAVLDQAIADGVQSLLVLEDDARPAENFSAQARQFLGRTPDDWDLLMFGGQHLALPETHCPGVFRCTAANRMHAYGIRGSFMGAVSRWWKSIRNDHCDVALAAIMRYCNAYAPDPFLVAQDAGASDISCEDEPLRWWREMPVQAA